MPNKTKSAAMPMMMVSLLSDEVGVSLVVAMVTAVVVPTLERYYDN